MTDSPKISFLVTDISAPAVGHVTSLAKMLEKHFEVEIVGPDIGASVSKMYEGQFDYTVVDCPRMYRLPDYFREVKKLGEAVTGDLIIADKAFANTVSLALQLKRSRGCKVVVYLDEWDGAVVRQQPWLTRLKQWLFHWHHPLEYQYHPIIERSFASVDGMISTNQFLQKRFGGEVIYLGVNMDNFSLPGADETAALKAQLDLSDKKLIVFGGVVRPHKGVEQVLDALVLLDDPSLHLLVVGPETEHLKTLKARWDYARYITATGSRSKDEMPSYLALADMVVLPLRNSLIAQSQTPCKVFEAMAMARPVIASAVSDLPLILEGAGKVVPPDDPRALADAIRWLADHPEEAEALGQAAREKCQREFSEQVTERQLVDYLQQIWQGAPSP